MIVVFDGACHFCNGWVAFVLKHDRRARYRFAAAQSNCGARILSAGGQDPLDPGTLVLAGAGESRVRSDAVLSIFWGLGGIWRLTAVLRLVPAPLRDALYSSFARRRYRWFGPAAVCAIPDARWQERFLS
ncbi:MAG: DCC1-like thiol-disulfide oxidoreductase family protein [Rhizomicrobium sp.]